MRVTPDFHFGESEFSYRRGDLFYHSSFCHSFLLGSCPGLCPYSFFTLRTKYYTLKMEAPGSSIASVTCTRLHCVTYQKTVIFRVTVTGTSHVLISVRSQVANKENYLIRIRTRFLQNGRKASRF